MDPLVMLMLCVHVAAAMSHFNKLAGQQDHFIQISNNLYRQHCKGGLKII